MSWLRQAVGVEWAALVLLNIWLCFNIEISASRKLTKTRTLLEAGILDVHPTGK